jgi:hypothetical protein
MLERAIPAVPLNVEWCHRRWRARIQPGALSLVASIRVLGLQVRFIIFDPCQNQLANVQWEESAPGNELLSDLFERKCSVCDENGCAIRGRLELTGINCCVQESPVAGPGERPFPMGLVVAELKPMNPVIGLIPHDKVEILIGNPTTMPVVRYWFDWLVCEHVRFEAKHGHWAAR